MAVQTISYANKSYINQNSEIADTNKVNDTDMNEIKSVVNNNATELTGVIGTSLYNNASGTTGNVSLSDSSANYDFIEIFFSKGDGSYNNCKIFSPNGKTTTLYCCNVYNSTSLQELFKNITISTTSITSNYGLARNSGTSGTPIIQQENSVKIYKVIGYKAS